MKIGIFVYKLDSNYNGGIKTYVLGLLQGFLELADENEFVIFCSNKNYEYFNNIMGEKKFKIINVDQDPSCYLLSSAIYSKICSLFTNYITVLPVFSYLFPIFIDFCYKPLFKYLDASGCEVFYTPYTFPLKVLAPVVSSMHDIQHVHYPEFFTFLEKARRNVYFKETVLKSRVLQVSSEYMANDFIKYFKLTKDRVVVIRDGVDSFFYNEIDQDVLDKVKSKYAITNNFVFYPAQHWLHKNHITLVDAISRLEKKNGIKIDIVLTGEKKQENDKLYTYINNSTIKNRIKMIGHILKEELLCFYKLSSIIVMPSLHESNSLVVLEALATGSVVIASDIEPNIELNDGSFVIFDKMNVEDLMNKVKFVLDNPQKMSQMVNQGIDLARGFTWERTAREYVFLFKSIKN